MQRDIIIARDFYEDPARVVRYARSLRYVTPYQDDMALAAGARPTWLTSWYRTVRACPFKSSAELLGRLEWLVGEPIDREYWCLDHPVDSTGHSLARRGMRVGPYWNCCFHAKFHNGQEIGAGVHSHGGRDIWNYVGETGWAGLVYLNPGADLEAGLRLWRNKDPRRNHDWMTPAGNWTLIDTLGNIPNRLILHRGALPHSGADGWGHHLANARFFQTFFFKTTRPAQFRGFRLDGPP